MSIWDSITGRKSQPSSSTPNAASIASAQPTTSSSPFAPEPTGGDFAAPQVPSFLNDPTLLHPLSNLTENSLDYLKLDDSILSDLPGSQSALPSRGWSDDLCYGTGCTYLAALSFGGLLGVQEGIRNIPPGAPGKIQLNAILNGVTRRGPFLGNSAGVVAMLYNGINSYIGYLRGRHDSTNSVAAGGLSGMIFRVTKGAKPMLISGAIVAGVAGAWTVARGLIAPSADELD